MTVDGDRLLVVETGIQQVTAIDLATGAVPPVIVGLDYSDRIPEAFFPFGAPSGVDATDRWIFVSDDGVNRCSGSTTDTEHSGHPGAAGSV